MNRLLSNPTAAGHKQSSLRALIWWPINLPFQYLRGLTNVLEWFVLRTHHAQEARAARELHNQRVKTFLPLGRELCPKRNGKMVVRIRPLFPRYLFVQLHWHRHTPVLSTRGVQSFVGYTAGMPKPPSVRKEDIQELRARLDVVCGREVINLSPQKRIEPEQLVKILFGPFRDHVAVVKEIKGSRVDVILTLLGATHCIPVEKSALLAA